MPGKPWTPRIRVAQENCDFTGEIELIFRPGTKRRPDSEAREFSSGRNVATVSEKPAAWNILPRGQIGGVAAGILLLAVER